MAASLASAAARICAPVGVALAIAAAPTSGQTAPPVTSRIEIGRDTVRFVVAQDGHLRTRYGYVRASGEWIPLNRAPGRWRERHPTSEREVSLGGGWSLAKHRSTVPGGATRERDVLRAPDGQISRLTPPIDSATLREVIEYTGEWGVNVARGLSGFSDGVQDWRHEGDTIWLASWGNWAALLRFDTVRRRLDASSTGWVANAIVGSMATTRRAVWLALRHPSGMGGRALARFDRATRTWTRLTPDVTLPDSEIVAMDGAGDTLWIATHEGLAAFDDATDRWDVRWFAAVPIVEERVEERFGQEYADSVIRLRWDLVRTRDPNENGTRVIIDVARSIEPSSPIGEDPPLDAARFLSVARSLPPEHFTRAWARYRRHDGIPESDLGRAMAHPRLVPFILRDSLRAVTLPGPAELRAFGLLGDRRYLPYVQWATRQQSSDAFHDATAAWARARLGDTTWLPLMRDLAVNRGWQWTSNWMADALLELGDSAIVDSILARVRREHTVWPLDWVQQNVPRERWHVVVHEAARTPDLHAVFMIYAHMYADRAALGDRATAAEYGHMARSVITSLRSDSAYDADTRRELVSAVTSYAVLQRDASLVPGLITLVGRDSATYVSAMNALLLLTAADSVPGSPGSGAAERATVQRFWERWWGERAASFALPTRQAGDATASRWWRRVNR